VYTAPLALLPGLSCPKYAGRPQAPQTPSTARASVRFPHTAGGLSRHDLKHTVELGSARRVWDGALRARLRRGRELREEHN